MLLKLQGRSFHVPFGRNWIHLIIAGMLNVVAFGLFGTFAQLSTATTRVVIINYSMPIWASFMAWLILRERMNAWALTGLALCIAGLAVLVYPVAATSVQEPTGLILAFFCSLSWAAGTIYMKAIRIEGDLLTIVMWQIMVGVVVFAIGYLIFVGPAEARGAAASHLARRRVVGRVRHRARVFHLVQHHRQGLDRHRLARHADESRGRRDRLDADPGRADDHRRRGRLCPDLRRRGLRAAAAATAGRRKGTPGEPNKGWTTPPAPGCCWCCAASAGA